MDYTDPQARQRALDPTQSFIVQAPAGSGKTELLTQRFLKLLVTVSSPEEIIAITFTRKAAAEMRHRILSALNVAASGITPSEPHKQTTFALATQALQQDAQHQWHLLDNPNRLRILTIDALAGFLSAQIPILAGFGSKPDIDDDVGSLYQEAARELVSGVGQDTPWQAHLDTLLLHLDNQTQRVVSLLCSILAKREQWLPHVLSYHGDVAQLHQHLEQGLQAIAEDAIQDLVTEIDPDLLNSLCSLAYTAANNLQADGIAHPFIETPRPPASIDALALWKSLPELLLTQKNTWRKSITKRQGFPAKSDEKAQITHVLEQLTDHEGARDALTNLRFCPGLTYPAAQQSMIDALTQLLPILYAQLRLVFQSKGTIDFVELNLAALRALGEEDEPTDLALYLDYQIKHLLIDEFQDTSITQYSLLQRLTRGWEPDDGRSLFLVGDPMQSIYRFRDAEVGLFLRTEQHGINDIHLEKLTLHHNYRSDKTIIDWINTTFVSLFPAHADISQGSVSYAPSLATRESQTQGVCSYALHDQTKQQEAQCIIEIIRQLQQQPDTSIAILVRSRHHLSEITRALQQHQVAYQAVDLQTLADCSTVQDLVTLTRALLHRFDHIAWYALLRSPICGLTLHDLHALSAHIDNGVWHALSQHANTLSTEGQQRAARVITVLTAYFLEQGRKPFELALEGVWRTLGGNDIATPQQRRNAARYFMLVADLVATHTTLSIDHLTQQLAKTYIEPEKTQSNLSIMTIHKSKGLEFDHVIIPGLQASTSNNTHDLMLWLERPNRAGSIDLILAPIKQATKDKDAIYHYVQRIEKKKLDHELTRLLYVAATRAKKSLHLTACIDTNQDGEPQFKNGSFAGLLRHQFDTSDIVPVALESHAPTEAHLLKRVPLDWTPSYAILHASNADSDNSMPPPEDSFKRIVGTVIHERLASQRDIHVNARLRQLGISPTRLPQALDRIQIALANIKSDPRATWILDANHTDSQFEYPITTLIKGKVRHLIIDRTFVDAENTRWIIDYKTSAPNKDDQACFIAHEKALYREQLETYADAMSSLDTRPIMLGLYFPLFCGWIAWDYQSKKILTSHEPA